MRQVSGLVDERESSGAACEFSAENTAIPSTNDSRPLFLFLC